MSEEVKDISDKSKYEIVIDRSEAIKKAIDIAEESEKAIVNIETLQKTNQNLIETLDKVIEIITDDGFTGWGEAVIEGKASTVGACVKEMEEYLLSLKLKCLENCVKI